MPIIYLRSASFLLVALLFWLCLFNSILPGLLGVCLGYWLNLILLSRVSAKYADRAPLWTTACIIIAPLLLLVGIIFYLKGSSMGLLAQYKDLLSLLAQTVLDLKQKLPKEMASHLPQDTTAVQESIAAWIRGQAGNIAHAGQVGAGGVLRAYVGLVIGALMVTAMRKPATSTLVKEIRTRASLFLLAFKQIVAAQFWIATFNASLTAIFLFAILPWFDAQLPYSLALVALTFFAGLIPIVGNLLCNGVLTLVGISVSPLVGISCLLFLIAIHKTEYFINAKFVGRNTKTAVWEMLAVMFTMEAVFGAVGLVAAPLFYAYVKSELKRAELI